MPTSPRARAVARTTVLAAMVAVPTLAVVVAASPAHAVTSVVPPAGAHYTLSVTGNGTRSLVFWSAARQGGATTGTRTATPVTTLPWHRTVPATADLYQVVAIQQQGTRLRCTIRNSSGRVVSSATSLGRNAVVTCTLSKRNLFSLSALG